MSAQGIDAEDVIRRLSQQVGRMAAELAMRDVALDAANARIAELEGKTEPGGEAGSAGPAPEPGRAD